MEGRRAHVEPGAVGGVVGALGAGLAVARAVVGLWVAGAALAGETLRDRLPIAVHRVGAEESLGDGARVTRRDAWQPLGLGRLEGWCCLGGRLQGTRARRQ